MRNQDIMLITADGKDVEINRNELAQRLGTARGYSNELIESCRERLEKIITYKCAYIRIPINRPGENIIDLGYMQVESRQLYNNMNGCQEAFAMALT